MEFRVKKSWFLMRSQKGRSKEKRNSSDETEEFEFKGLPLLGNSEIVVGFDLIIQF